MGSPALAVASLALAWALLATPGTQGATPNGPCSPNMRHRLSASASETASIWLSAVALFGVGATWVFLCYALWSLCAKKALYRNEPGVQGNTELEVCPEGGREGSPDTSSSQAIASAQPRGGGPRKAKCEDVQQAYAQQLAFMAEELEGFLREVRNQQCTLGSSLPEENAPTGPKQDAGKPRITVYEITDYEAAGQERQRGRKRKKSDTKERKS